MQIAFNKIKNAQVDIDYSKDKSNILGYLERVNKDSVKLEANFSTKVTLTCNRCGKEFEKGISYPLNLLLTDGAYRDKDEIDIVEFFEGKIDFEYLLKSELSLIEGDYNYCDDCKESEDIFEKEF